jgi:hypothetical protein
MKVELVRLDSANKHHPFLSVLRRFKSVYTLQGKNQTTEHTQSSRAQRVATVHDVIKESGQVLPHPSAVLHAYASTDTPWVARTLSHGTPVKRGMVSPNLATHKTTQFAGPQKISYATVHNQSLFIQTQPTRAIIDTCGATTVEL